MTPQTNLARLLALLLAAVTFAGCAGDDDGGDMDDDNDMDDMDDGMEEPQVMAPIYINGTAQGILDCTLNALVGQSLTSSSESVSSDAWNGTYTVTQGGVGAPGPVGDFCIVWSDGSAASQSGTVPDGVTGFDVYVDLGYDVGYSMKIEPAIPEA